jgi:PKD repeat protein
MKTKFFLFLPLVAIIAITGSSCKKTPAPTAEIYATIDGYKVTFEPTVTDTQSYLWDFGDGKTSTEAKPVHTYAMSGTYNVVLTVTGDGGTGTSTKEVVITPSLTEMLTGGPAATNGKTWVMSTAYAAGQDGGGPVVNSMPILLPSAENVLTMFGLGAEYDNEYTFYSDGRYKINPKNGNVLAGAVYGYVTQTMQGNPSYDIGMCAASYTAPASATWTMGTADFVVDAITDPNTTAVPPVHGNVTFTGKNWISLSSGAFFGIMDFPATPRFIVKELTPTKMNVAMFLCGYGYGTDLNMMKLPTNLIHITFVPKAK